MSNRKQQRSSAYMIPAKSAEPINTSTYIDELGLRCGIDRNPGESITSFKLRLAYAQYHQLSTTYDGLMNFIDITLGLSQFNALRLTTIGNFAVEVRDTDIIFTNLSNYSSQVVNLVSYNTMGEWKYKTISGVAAEITSTVDGISCTAFSNAKDLPAILIYNQSSIKTIRNELVPPVDSFKLGLFSATNISGVTFLKDRIFASDNNVFQTQVSGTPATIGEWSISDNGTVRLFSLPANSFTISYAFNKFNSGLPLVLYGNGVKLIELSSENTQNSLFESGIAYEQLTDVASEIYMAEQTFWG